MASFVAARDDVALAGKKTRERARRATRAEDISRFATQATCDASGGRPIAFRTPVRVTRRARVVGRGSLGGRARGSGGSVWAPRAAAREITARHATRAEIARPAKRISSTDPRRSRVVETRGRFSRRR